ncbi:unnamed protein product [Cuscuta europaea]|uniref:Glutathione S-transferase n=1 Tax=Cuscuta europaea TaxID=41803 RepID=A0A9P1ED49_CUSEU|nr:unnamed protein product [Cuscuta europaea]
MTSNNVKLLGVWWSPFVIRVRVALNLKSVDYDFIEETFMSKSELLLELNPVNKKIPVLVHNDKPICESIIIAQYIGDVWNTSGSPIFPCDLYGRAVTKFWSVYIDDKIFPISRSISLAGVKGVEKEVICNLVEALAPLEDIFKGCSKGKKFFGGDRIEYLDIALGSLIGWFKVTDEFNDVKLFDETKFPNLSSWVDNFVVNDAVKDVLPPGSS